MKFYGQFNLDEWLYNGYFRNYKNGFFVECGAYDGILDSTCKFFEESLNWTGMNIEAVPYIFDKLVENRPHSTNIKCALSDTNSSKVFTQAIHPKFGRFFGNGSLSHSREHRQQLDRKKCSFEKFEVECKKFADILIPARKIDLFVLDVEGHELEAIDGILPIGEQYLPKVFFIEHTVVGIDSISAKLTESYTLDKVYKHNAVFVKK